jgi:hypothetical protein
MSKAQPSQIILFGAGASFGSDKGGTPPLGDDLFRELKKFNPDGWGRLPDSLSSLFMDSFEEGMEEVSKRNSHLMPVLQRAMAGYFFTFWPKESNCYYKLAKSIQRKGWDGAFATLNYDRLLEVSLLAANLQPVTALKNLTDKQFEICLPHGSCHLFCEGVKASSQGVSFSGVGVHFDGPVQAVTNSSEFWRRIKSDAIPPVMSYFQPEKNTSAGSTFIEDQRDRFKELVTGAEHISIVGVRVRPEDKHIWGPFSETKAKISCFSGKSGGKEFEEWARKNERERDKAFYGYFKDNLEKLI